MTYTKPNIQDGDKFSVSQACRVLDIVRNTFYAKCKEYGIFVHTPKKGGRGYYTGKELMTIWNRG